MSCPFSLSSTPIDIPPGKNGLDSWNCWKETPVGWAVKRENYQMRVNKWLDDSNQTPIKLRDLKVHPCAESAQIDIRGAKPNVAQATPKSHFGKLYICIQVDNAGDAKRWTQLLQWFHLKSKAPKLGHPAEMWGFKTNEHVNRLFPLPLLLAGWLGMSAQQTK